MMGPISARPFTYTKNLLISAVTQAKRAEIELRRKTPKSQKPQFKVCPSAIFATSAVITAILQNGIADATDKDILRA